MTNEIKYSEEEFLERFGKFINEITSVSELHIATSANLDDFFNESIESKESTEESDDRFLLLVKRFIEELNNSVFNNKLIPYAKITEEIYLNLTADKYDILISLLKKYGHIYFENLEDDLRNEVSVMTYYKIIRHIELAITQSIAMSNINTNQLEALEKEKVALSIQYSELKEKHTALQTQFIVMEQKANHKYDSLFTQFVTILGIFATIMIGSFGAIQAFSDLFKNAHGMDLGKLLIISSVGASSVILILFFLLNAIAKLTDRNIGSSQNKEESLLAKYPILFMSFGLLLFIALIGAAMLLINYKLQPSWYGFWWGLPLAWLYIGAAIYFKSPKLWWKFSKQPDMHTPVTSGKKTDTNTNG